MIFFWRLFFSDGSNKGAWLIQVGSKNLVVFRQRIICVIICFFHWVSVGDKTRQNRHLGFGPPPPPNFKNLGGGVDWKFLFLLFLLFFFKFREKEFIPDILSPTRQKLNKNSFLCVLVKIFLDSIFAIFRTFWVKPKEIPTKTPWIYFEFFGLFKRLYNLFFFSRDFFTKTKTCLRSLRHFLLQLEFYVYRFVCKTSNTVLLYFFP